MKDKISLKERIVRSIYIYETKQITLETVVSVSVFFISLFIIIIFGGLALDIYNENELGLLLGDFTSQKQYSLNKLQELGAVFTYEIPAWIVIVCLIGFLMGCILVMSIIKNWRLIVRKARSLFNYWFSI